MSPQPHQRNTVRVDCDRVGASSVPVDDIYVNLALGRDRAYMVHPCGGGALHWTEISLRHAELLVVLGAHAEIDFGLGSDADASAPPRRGDELSEPRVAAGPEAPLTGREGSWNKRS